MATPGQLIGAVSMALGISRATAFQYDRNLVLAGHRSMKGRGRGAASVTAGDAANLLISILASPSPGEAVQSLEVYGRLPAHEFLPRNILANAFQSEAEHGRWYDPGTIQTVSEMIAAGEPWERIKVAIAERGFASPDLPSPWNRNPTAAERASLTAEAYLRLAAHLAEAGNNLSFQHWLHWETGGGSRPNLGKTTYPKELGIPLLGELAEGHSVTEALTATIDIACEWMSANRDAVGAPVFVPWGFALTFSSPSPHVTFSFTSESGEKASVLYIDVARKHVRPKSTLQDMTQERKISVRSLSTICMCLLGEIEDLENVTEATALQEYDVLWTRLAELERKIA